MLEANLSFKEIPPQNNSNQEEHFREGQKRRRAGGGQKGKAKADGVAGCAQYTKYRSGKMLQ